MNQRFDFSLSLNNAKDIQFDKYENDFTFIVDGKAYQTNRYFADVISPIVRNYHYNDKTIDEFTFNTKLVIQDYETNSANQIDYFQDFLNLATFEKVEINNLQQRHFAEYFLHLGNMDEFYRLEQEYFGNLTPDNVVDRLKYFDKIGENVSISNFSKIISYSASNFTEINKDELKTLSLEIIEEIIKNESFQLDEEDTLLQFILDLYENDKKYSPLFEYVIFNNVKQNTFENFINIFSIDDLNLAIWHSINKRSLFKKVQNHINRYSKKNEVNIQFRKGEEFNGILNYLKKEKNGNIHDNGTIEITSNSIISSDRHPKNLIDYDGSSLYHSKDEKNVEICFDFKDKKIQLENYTIKSYMCGKNTNNLKNWVIEGSNEGKEWEVIDHRENDNELNGTFMVATFNVEKSDNFFRYIRLRQTGPNWMNKNFVIIHSLEFYGTIKKGK